MLLHGKEKKRTCYNFGHWLQKPYPMQRHVGRWYSVLHLQKAVHGIDVMLGIARIAGAHQSSAAIKHGQSTTMCMKAVHAAEA